MSTKRRSARLRVLALRMLERAKAYPAEHPQRVLLVRGARYLERLARLAEDAGNGDSGPETGGARK